jgi:hypothetical protein
VSSTLSFTFRMEILALTLLGWMVIYFFVNRLQVEPERRLDLGTDWDRKTPYVPLFFHLCFCRPAVFRFV